MDFKNIIQKNVGNMKSKIPSMPNLPKIPKIKSRKIFNLNRSKENISDKSDFSTSQLSIGPSSSQILQLPATSSIINRSPSRISTISSLVEGEQAIDYHISDTSDNNNKNRRRIHFQDNNDTNNDEKSTSTLRFTERLTKQYKELSEFKFSHIFGKKTIVRTTEIQVDMYKHSFEEQNNELNAERRMSNDYEFEFRSIPAVSINSADEPQSPTAPIAQSIISRTPSTSMSFQQESSEPHNLNEIRNDSVNTQPPLSRRKVFKPKGDESPAKTKQNWKFKGFKKKSIEVNDDGDGVTQSSIKSKSPGAMWRKLKKSTKIPASQDSIDDNPENFKKSLNNIFKKFPSLSSFDEPSDTKSPKKPGMWKLQRPVRIKVSTEDISSESNVGTDSEFMKQFNKIVGKSSKIKNLIGKESTNPINENVSQQIDTEDPSKVKSIEEIESLGYGRKNMKYINMWKIRRRREIRRTEPFPLSRTNSLEEDKLKTSGMWQLRRPIRTKTFINEGDPVDNSKNPQLADITKSLMNMFKRNQQSAEETAADGETQERKKRNSIWKKHKTVPTTGMTDENVDMNGNSPKIESKSTGSAQSRMWKFRQASGTESFDTDHNVKQETENKPGFWKKKSPKKTDSQIENNNINVENVIVKQNILDKAKTQIKSHINVIQESQESEHESIKTIDNKYKFQQSMDSFKSFDDSDHETLEDSEKINKNLSWGRQNMLSNAYSTDSDDEEIITKPGFIQNQLISTKYGEIEPTIIIVSKPVPPILQYDSVIQQQRIYPLLPLEQRYTPPPITPSPSLPKNIHLLELPCPVVLPTPPLPKRHIFTPEATPSPSPSPPLLPASFPPQLSPPKSLPPPLPTSARPQLSNFPTLSPILQPTRLHMDNTPRTKHSRKPSMDSNDSDSRIADNLRNRNILELNQFDETFEQWNSVNKSNIKDNSLKKWQSIDIFNSNDEIFDDFDDELKNEPVIAIAENILQQQPVLSQVKNNPDLTQPTGVPVTFVKHNITRPLVKQGSLRRQFSEEKDAEDLNKKRNVNKMITRFDPERYSSRRSIKNERIQINSITTQIKDIEEKIILSKASVDELDKKQINLITTLNKSSSMDVEIDKNDLQSMNEFTSTEDDSDNNDSGIKHIPVVLERKQPTDIPIVLTRKQSTDIPVVLAKKQSTDIPVVLARKQSTDIPVVLARKQSIDIPVVLAKKQSTSINKNMIIPKVHDKSVVKVLERKLAPTPPSTIQITTQTTKCLNNNNQNEDNQKQINTIPVIKDQTIHKSIKDSNENIKKHILQGRQQSEDNFYSLDYTDEDETVKRYPLDGISLVKEEYSIDL